MHFGKEIPQPVRVIIIIVIILLLLLAGNFVYRQFRKPANAEYISSEEAIPPGWTPNDAADTMYKAIDGLFTLADTKNDAAKNIMDLNDNQVIDVYNYWNKEYSTKSILLGFGMVGSLTKAMSAEWNVPAIGTGTNYWDALTLRLKELKLP